MTPEQIRIYAEARVAFASRPEARIRTYRDHITGRVVVLIEEQVEDRVIFTRATIRPDWPVLHWRIVCGRAFRSHALDVSIRRFILLMSKAARGLAAVGMSAKVARIEAERAAAKLGPIPVQPPRRRP